MSKLRAVPKTVREELSRSFYELFRSAKERKGLKLFSFGRKLRRFAEKPGHRPEPKMPKRLLSGFAAEKTAGTNYPKTPGYLP
jgi:hypothetical protein